MYRLEYKGGHLWLDGKDKGKTEVTCAVGRIDLLTLQMTKQSGQKKYGIAGTIRFSELWKKFDNLYNWTHPFFISLKTQTADNDIEVYILNAIILSEGLNPGEEWPLEEGIEALWACEEEVIFTTIEIYRSTMQKEL